MLPITLVAHSDYPKMFYVQWEDGVLSMDFYNLTRASSFIKFGEDDIDYTGFDDKITNSEHKRRRKGRNTKGDHKQPAEPNSGLVGRIRKTKRRKGT